MYRRIKNLIELSKYSVLNGVELSEGTPRITPPRLVYDAKPKKKLATIVEDLPDLFEKI